jgi:hypothetical protein
LLLGGLTGGIMGYLDARAGRDQAATSSLWALFIVTIAAAILAMIWGLKYWRAIDEMAKRAHLDAFYWGGSIAWCFLIPFGIIPLKFKSFKLEPIENLANSDTQAFAWGICFAVGMTLIGYTIFWLFWWAKKR